jgi:hypothetical protein
MDPIFNTNVMILMLGNYCLGGWGFSSMVECMPSIYKTLDLIPSTKKKEKVNWRV